MTRHQYLVLGLLVALHLAGASTVPYLMHDVWTFGAAVGLWLGQIQLIVLWALLRRGAWVMRLAWLLLLANLLWHALLLGDRLCAMSDPSLAIDVPGNAMAAGILTFVGVITACLAQGLTLFFYRWRLYTHTELANAHFARATQFSLRQLMLLIFLVCLALAVNGWLIPRASPATPEDPQLKQSLVTPVIMIGSLIAGLILPVLGLVTVLPTVWATFTPFRYWYRMARVGVLAMGFLSVLETLLLVRTNGDSPHAGGLFLTVMFYNLVQCASVHVTFLVLRISGFQLVREEPAVGRRPALPDSRPNHGTPAENSVGSPDTNPTLK